MQWSNNVEHGLNAPEWFTLKMVKKKNGSFGAFPGGPVVKNPSASAKDMGSIPGPGRSHMPRGN